MSRRRRKPAAQPPPSRFIRELSWLAFNERVLDQAADKTTPLLERAPVRVDCSIEPRQSFSWCAWPGLKGRQSTSPRPTCRHDADRNNRRHGGYRFVDRLYAVVMTSSPGARRTWRASRVAGVARRGAARVAHAVLSRCRHSRFSRRWPSTSQRPFPRVSSLSLNIAVLPRKPFAPEEPAAFIAGTGATHAAFG